MQRIQITKVELDADDGILVTFSDGTITGYVAEELIRLRPYRETIELSTRARILDPEDQEG
jgi:hypothetical protein